MLSRRCSRKVDFRSGISGFGFEDATTSAQRLAATPSGASKVDTRPMSERKPTIGFWAAVASVAALAYGLSFGPVVWLTDRKILPDWVHSPAAFVYAPVVHVSLA